MRLWREYWGVVWAARATVDRRPVTMRASPGTAPRLFRTSSSTRARSFPSSSTKALAMRRETSSFRFTGVFITLPFRAIHWVGGRTKKWLIGPTAYCIRSDQKDTSARILLSRENQGVSEPSRRFDRWGGGREAGAPPPAGLASRWGGR